jgi:hypothetical protein
MAYQVASVDDLLLDRWAMLVQRTSVQKSLQAHPGLPRETRGIRCCLATLRPREHGGWYNVGVYDDVHRDVSTRVPIRVLFAGQQCVRVG